MPPFGIAPYILHAIVEQLGSRCLVKYNDMRKCKALLDNPAIYSMITDGMQNGFKKLQLLSKDLLWSVDCMSNICMIMIELLQEGEYQSKVVQKQH